MSNSQPSGDAWTMEAVLALSRDYQGAAVLAAAAELELFTPLATVPQTAADLAKILGCHQRGLETLLDSLVALGLLEKHVTLYTLRPGIREHLTPESPHSVLAMVQHQANCMRRWDQLASVVKTGKPAQRAPSVRGEQGDAESFIMAMHNISAPVAREVITAVHPLTFRHLLDIGGASGTWTIEFLRACPTGRATLFDLPHVIPMAERRLRQQSLADRVSLVAGDFMADELPSGADLAWVSAIVHQNSREQNRFFLAKIFKALTPGGRIAIRDIVMEESRTRPSAGALFALNMLVATEGGGTFTFDELRGDLEYAGFTDAKQTRKDEGMHSVVVATKPQ